MVRRDEEEMFWERQGLHSNHLAPRNVSQVCQSWRDIVFDSSLLWSTLSVKTSDVFRRGFTLEDLVSVTKDRLRMSGNAPLTLSLSLGYPGIKVRDPRDPVDVLHTFVDTLLSERHRWKKMAIFSFLYPKKMILPVFRDLPLLEDLLISLPMPLEASDANKYPMKIDLSSCANLKTLKLDGNIELVSTGTVLRKLAHVELTRHTNSPFSFYNTFTALHATTIVQLAPALVTLVLDIFPSVGFRILPALMGEDIRLEHLEELRINTVDKDDAILVEIMVFFDRLVLPSLKILDVELTNSLDVAKLVERSGCSIATLAFDGSRKALQRDALEALVVSWLSQMPDLQELTINNVEISSTLIAHLTLPVPAHPAETRDDDEADVGLCPSLKNLRLIQSDFAERNLVRSFVNMLRTRIRGVGGSVGKLEKFYAGDCDVRDIAKHTAVREWFSQGVDFVFY